MKAKHLVSLFQSMVGWDYQWGAARWGCVDCSGAFVYAFGLFDQDIYHGSNTIFRKYLISHGTLPNESLSPGTAVFKCRDGDDYYHIGLYIGEDRVVEAKGTNFGVVISALGDGWTHWGMLAGVEYSTQDGPESDFYPFEAMEPVAVVTRSGRLNLRVSPGGTILERLESGTRLTPLVFRGQWVRVLTLDGQTGWVDGSYLSVLTDSKQEEEKPASSLPDSDALTASLWNLYLVLGEVLGVSP